MRGRLGDVLQAEGRISREQAEWAAEVAARDGARIGSLLVAAGLVRRGELYRVLARMWDCPYVDLTDAVTHDHLLDGLDPHELAAEGWFPVRYEAAGRHGSPTVLVATCEEPGDELAARIERRLGSPVTLHVTTDWDIVQALHVGFRETDEEVAALDPAGLPAYMVLVPVFREANIVADPIENLGGLESPPEKLEILLLLEEDDTETIEAARAADPPATFHFLIIPPGRPQTKPKACNVGLFLARGEHLVIYDAEDKPDADQLKKTVVAFRRGGERLVCVQAAMNYWNAIDNWLTRMFTAEYSFWFDYMLPGLDRLRLPIPLGGTSNRFRTAGLRALGGWDPFNVTEDADLGIRAAALGHTVGVINSTTFEEANRAPGNWVRQRSRWVKGYLQTLLVHLRHPVSLVRATGLRQTTAFALLIGGTPMTFLCTPPLYALFLASLLLPPDVLAGLFPGWVLWVSLFNLVIGNGLMIYVSMMGAFKRRRYTLVLWAVLNPLYWILHSIAAYKAVWQLVTKPHYGEKTLHGLSHAAGLADVGGRPAPSPAG